MEITRQQRDAGRKDCEYIHLYLFTTSKDRGELGPGVGSGARTVWQEVSEAIGAWASRRGSISCFSVDSLHYRPVLLGFVLHKYKGFAGRKQLGG